MKLRDTGMAQAQSTISARLARLATDAASDGVALTYHRAMAIGAHVMALGRPLTLAAANAVAARIAQNPDVEFVQPDMRRHAYRTTNDPLLGSQPYLGSVVGGINVFSAWDVTTGSSNVVIAVVDTGYRPHADLAGRMLPGYDFISDTFIANDGDHRDADATDPGDWVTAADLKVPECTGTGATESPSSWHGTSVAGIIAANSNNNQWLAGVDWAAKILPVRVLGKCGGWDSDIMDGVAWAAGLAVPGVPANPYPAQVINLSLGGSGACTAAYQNVFDSVLAHGVTRAIIAAAGNDTIDASMSVPAGCSGVIAVAATTREGSLADYSNFGSSIALSAPGGSVPNFDTDNIALLFNDGTTIPGADAWGIGAGTSYSAPLVAGVASLVLSVAPNLSAAQLRALLTSTASPFPAGSDCSTVRCGAGIVNAYAAVLAAQGGAPATNYQGMWWNAPANSESGWGLNLTHQGDTIFASWFTYDLSGRGWWLEMSAQKIGTNTYKGQLLETTGPPFNSSLFTPNPVPSTPVGTGTLIFSDANNGTFNYIVNKDGTVTQQTKNITRFIFSMPVPTCVWGGQSNAARATNYQDMWWNAPANSESGWGLNLTHQGDTIFASWFTYDLSGRGWWLEMSAQKTGAKTYQGQLLETTGPPFNSSLFTPNPVPSTPVGTGTLIFSDASNGTFNYTVNKDGTVTQQTKNITRFIFSNSGTICQ